MSRYLELAKKLKALAEQGVGGEKSNAEMQLKKLMAKHNISLEELETNTKSWCLFKIKRGHRSRDLLFQIVTHVLAESSVRFYRGKQQNQVEIECTPEQHIEIECKYAFYLSALLVDEKIFYRAFIQKNKLFNPAGGSQLIGELSEKDRQEALKVLLMTESMEKHQFSKQLKG